MWTHVGTQCVLVPPASTPRSRRRIGKQAVAVTSVRGQMMEQDLVANAVASAAFNLWAAEYPAAAKAGTFMGQHASRQHIANRVKLLQDALNLDWAQVLGLVRTDSRVLFVSSANHIQQVVFVLERELGGRDAAMDVVVNQPAILFAGVSTMHGKGEWLKTMADLSNAARPFYRAIRMSAIFPEPLEWDLGLP